MTTANKYDPYGFKRDFIRAIAATTPENAEKDLGDIITNLIPYTRKKKEQIQNASEAEDFYNQIDNEFQAVDDLIGSIMDNWKTRMHVLQVALGDLADIVMQWPNDMPKIAPTLWDVDPALKDYWEGQIAPALNAVLPDPNSLDQYSNNVLKLFGTAKSIIQKERKSSLAEIAQYTLDPFQNPHQVDVSYASFRAITRRKSYMSGLKQLAKSAPLIKVSPWTKK